VGLKIIDLRDKNLQIVTSVQALCVKLLLHQVARVGVLWSEMVLNHMPKFVWVGQFRIIPVRTDEVGNCIRDTRDNCC
jgi:hypothetical protein